MKKHWKLITWTCVLFFINISCLSRMISHAHPTPIPGSDVIFPSDSARPILTRTVNHTGANFRRPTTFRTTIRRSSTVAPFRTHRPNRDRIPLTPKTQTHSQTQQQRWSSSNDTWEQPLMPPMSEQGKPTCARTSNYSFCEQVDDYPDQEIRQLIKYSPEEFHDIYGSLVVNSRRTYDDDEISEERICKQRTNVFYPRVAQNEVEEWVYVVNDVDYTQTVTAEMCDQEGRSCAFLDTNLPPAFRSICRQRYAYKRLLAVHPKEKKTYTDSFPIPSCCVCYVKYPPMFTGRSSRIRKAK